MKENRPLLRYFFSFNDPYSFIITPEVKQLGHDYKIDIDYIPLPGFDQRGIFSADELEARYYDEDAARFAKERGREIRYLPAPLDSGMVCLLKPLFDREMLGLKFINLIFALRWVSEGDISDLAAVKKAVSFLEMDPQKIDEAANSDAGAYEVKRAEELARQEGVIGVPFFTFQDEHFYGADRLAQLAARLAADPSLLVRHDASYGVMTFDELTKALTGDDPPLVLDIRIPKEFEVGHIPGANCLPGKIVARNTSRIPHRAVVVIDNGGATASETALFLAGEGFGQVFVLKGGHPSWGGEVETGLGSWQDKLLPKE